MQPGTVLFLHLFNRLHLAAEACKLRKLLLDGLQPFMPLPMSELRLGSVRTCPAILLVQFLDLGNLGTKPPDLFSKNFQMVHTSRITYPGRLVGRRNTGSTQEGRLR